MKTVNFLFEEEYSSPQIKVVEVSVENGFAGTGGLAPGEIGGLDEDGALGE